MRLSRAKILLVDGDATQQLTASWLQALGIGQVTRAHDAGEAAEALERLRWDLVIIDCDALGGPGLERLRDARQQSSALNRDTPLILVASADDESLVPGLEAFGPADRLLKPLAPRAFCAEITDALMQTAGRRGPEHFGDLDARLG